MAWHAGHGMQMQYSEVSYEVCLYNYNYYSYADGATQQHSFQLARTLRGDNTNLRSDIFMALTRTQEQISVAMTG